MSFEVIIPISLSLLTIVISFISYYFYAKNKILNNTIDVINIAEDSDKIKEEKMQLAISEIKKLLPPGATLIFTDAVIEDLIQKAFDKIEEFAHKQN